MTTHQILSERQKRSLVGIKGTETGTQARQYFILSLLLEILATSNKQDVATRYERVTRNGEDDPLQVELMSPESANFYINKYQPHTRKHVHAAAQLDLYARRWKSALKQEPFTTLGIKLDYQSLSFTDALPYLRTHVDPEFIKAITERPMRYLTSPYKEGDKWTYTYHDYDEGPQVYEFDDVENIFIEFTEYQGQVQGPFDDDSVVVTFVNEKDKRSFIKLYDIYSRRYWLPNGFHEVAEHYSRR